MAHTCGASELPCAATDSWVLCLFLGCQPEACVYPLLAGSRINSVSGMRIWTRPRITTTDTRRFRIFLADFAVSPLWFRPIVFSDIAF